MSVGVRIRCVQRRAGDSEDAYIQWKLSGVVFQLDGGGCDIESPQRDSLPASAEVLEAEWETLEIDYLPRDLDWVGMETFEIVGVGSAIESIEPGCTYEVFTAGVHLHERNGNQRRETRLSHSTGFGADWEVIQGKPEIIEQALVTFLAGGHLLLRRAWRGKNHPRKPWPIALGGSFSRIQFHLDMLPSDVIGVTILDPETQQIVFREGPIFGVVLADEINRSPPKRSRPFGGDERTSRECGWVVPCAAFAVYGRGYSKPTNTAGPSPS